MTSIKFTFLAILISFCAACASSNGPVAFSGDVGVLESEAQQTLTDFVTDHPASAALADEAFATLVFPSVVKGGFFYGAHYGRGALLQDDTPTEYYSSSSASYGFQAGVQRFTYVMFFMNQEALDYFLSTKGFELGVGPGVTIFNIDVARVLTTTTVRDDIYACIYDAQGLMAGSGLQGTKITKLELDQST